MNNENIPVTPPDDLLPRQIKQLGSLEEGQCHIYIEDYVYTYLMQLSKSDLSKFHVAVLLGEYIYMEDKRYYLISGAVQPTTVNKEGDLLFFNESSMDHIEDMTQEYFQDKLVLGWMNSQPGYGGKKTNYHTQVQEGFKDSNHVLFVMDSIEKSFCFYEYDGQSYNPCSGYFIYYEQNTPMQEYMTREGNTEDCSTEEKEDAEPQELQEVKGTRNPIELLKGLIQKYNSPAYLIIMVLFLTSLVLALTLTSTYNKLQVTRGEYAELANELIQQRTMALLKEQTEDKITPQENIQDDSEEALNAIDQPIQESYVVKLGDTLNSISQTFYGSTDMVEDIVSFNNLESKHQIYEGQKLKLPPKGK